MRKSLDEKKSRDRVAAYLPNISRAFIALSMITVLVVEPVGTWMFWCATLVIVAIIASFLHQMIK